MSNTHYFWLGVGCHNHFLAFDVAGMSQNKITALC